MGRAKSGRKRGDDGDDNGLKVVVVADDGGVAGRGD